MTRSFWQKRNVERLDDVDVVVVGGGMTGLSAAHWLTRLDPDAKVILLERGLVASGASGRNAGFLIQGHATSFAEDVDRFGMDDAVALWEYTLENRDLLLSTLGDEELRARRSGSATVAGSVREAKLLEESASLLSDAGHTATYLDATETNTRLHSEGFFGGLFVPTGATLDPVACAHAIANGAAFSILEGRKTHEITSGPRGCRVHADGLRVDTRRVVVAVNAATSQLLPEVTGTVVPVRAQMLSTEPVPYTLKLPVYSHEGYYYVRQEPNGCVLVGGARNRHELAERGFEDATTAPLQQDLVEYVTTHFPWANGLNVSGRWSGTMGFTETKLPRLGVLPDRGPVTWIGGFSGHGMSMAFVAGRAVAEVAMGQRTHPVVERLFRG